MADNVSGLSIYQVTWKAKDLGGGLFELEAMLTDSSGNPIDSSHPLPVTLAAGAITGATDSGPTWTPGSKFTAAGDWRGGLPISLAPASGKTVCADDVVISTDTAMTFTITNGQGGGTLYQFLLVAGQVVPLTLRDGLRATATNTQLYGVSSVTGNVTVTTNQHDF